MEEKEDEPANAPPTVPRRDDADRDKGGDHSEHAQNALPGLLHAGHVETRRAYLLILAGHFAHFAGTAVAAA